MTESGDQPIGLRQPIGLGDPVGSPSGLRLITGGSSDGLGEVLVGGGVDEDGGCVGGVVCVVGGGLFGGFVVGRVVRVGVGVALSLALSLADDDESLGDSDGSDGVSITDGCVGWEETESLILSTYEQLP